MAESSWPKLPSELRGLVDFLEADERPTALLNDWREPTELLNNEQSADRHGKLYDFLNNGYAGAKCLDRVLRECRI